MLQGIARPSAIALVTSFVAAESAVAKLIFKVAFVPDTTGSTAQHKDIVVNAAQTETARDTMGVWRAITRMEEGDIVADVKAGRARLDALKHEKLPDNVRKLAPAAPKPYLDRQMRERNALNARLGELVKKRDQYVAEARRRAPPTRADFFDRVMETTLRAQIKR